MLGEKFVPICTITYWQLYDLLLGCMKYCYAIQTKTYLVLYFFMNRYKYAVKKILFKLKFFLAMEFFNFSWHSKNELQKLFSCYVYCNPFLAQLSWKLCFYAQSLFVCLSWWHDETYILEIKKKLYEFFKKEFDLKNIKNIFFYLILIFSKYTNS